MTGTLSPTPGRIDLAGLPPAVRRIVEAAQRLDREHLDEVEVHVCDMFDDGVRRQRLYAERRGLSDALAEAGLTLPMAR